MRQRKLSFVSGAVVVSICGVLAVLAWLRVGESRTESSGQSNGEALFEEKGCVNCHYANTTEDKIGPGLKGLMDRETLPESGWEATRENVKKQLLEPYDNMPSYEGRLSEKEMQVLLDYIGTL